MSTDLKNVLIVGASVAGATLARTLDTKLPPTHRIVLVDAQDFAFWPLSGLRAAVVEGWEDRSFKPLAGFFPEGSRHVVLSKTRVVELGRGNVKVDVANSSLGFSDHISFDICVLALGTLYSFPGRPLGNTLADAKLPFKKAQQDLKNNIVNNVVIVGGGAVGIEYAGEIIAQYPKKNVTIIQSSDRLLSDLWPIKLSNKLQHELESRGVRVVLGQRVGRDVLDSGKGTVVLKDGTSIEADLVFNGTGPAPNTKIVAESDPGALNGSRFITTDENLRIISTAPNSPLTSGYYAIGDCAFTLGTPTALKAGNDASFASTNILASLSSKPLTPLTGPLVALIVPVGPTGGAGVVPYIGIVGAWFSWAMKGRSLVLSSFEKLYPY